MRSPVYQKDQKQYDDIIISLQRQSYWVEANEEAKKFGPRQPTLREMTFEISKISTVQKGVGAGGVGVVEKQIDVYEPIIQYVVSRPIPIGTENYSDTNRFKLVTYKATLGEILKKNKQQELFNEWNGAKGISSVREKICQDREIIEQASSIFNAGKTNLIEYNITFLKEKLEESKTPTQNDYSIIISRAPIDVLRMSDFRGISSCQSTGREYFYCALAESRNQGAIAYLVRTEDLENVNLDDEEIFTDYQRRVQGIEPISRVRIRRVVDENIGVDYMIPEDAVYGSKKAFFADTVMSWAAKAQQDMQLAPYSGASDKRVSLNYFFQF